MADAEDWWFKTSLARHYNIAEPTPYRNFPYGEELWATIWRLTETPDSSPLREPDMRDIVHQRMTGYIVSRLIVEADRIRQGFPPGDLSDPMERWLTTRLDEMIERVLDISETDRNHISDLLSSITRRVFLGQGEPTDGQKSAIASFAETNGHRCYLCASSLNFTSLSPDLVQALSPEEQEKAQFEHNRRHYELEHIYPVSRGGSRSRYNLSACCNECNKFKGNLTTFAEFPLETMIVASDQQNRVLETFGKRQRFGLFWRQQGRCKSCERPFFQISDERLFVVRQEKIDAYHFLNAQIICGECHDAGDYEGFQFRGN